MLPSAKEGTQSEYEISRFPGNIACFGGSGRSGEEGKAPRSGERGVFDCGREGGGVEKGRND